MHILLSFWIYFYFFIVSHLEQVSEEAAHINQNNNVINITVAVVLVINNKNTKCQNKTILYSNLERTNWLWSCGLHWINPVAACPGALPEGAIGGKHALPLWLSSDLKVTIPMMVGYFHGQECSQSHFSGCPNARGILHQGKNFEKDVSFWIIFPQFAPALGWPWAPYQMYLFGWVSAEQSKGHSRATAIDPLIMDSR